MHSEKDVDLAPIILFVYNRPWHTKQTVEALQKNKLSMDSELFIFSDGPKVTKESKTAVEEVRKYLKGIGGFKRIIIVERPENLGLADSVIVAVSEIVNKHGKAIIIEDDLVVAPCFLNFMNQALERYKNEDQVMQVSGHMFDVEIESSTDVVFLPFCSSWGWATWERAWLNFDPVMSGYDTLRKDKLLHNKFNLGGAYNYFGMLEKQKRGIIDSWAIRWYLSVFMLKGLTVYPQTSFVRNIGFDGSGTHCGRFPLSDELRFDDYSPKHQYNFSDPFVEPTVFRTIVKNLVAN